MLVTRRFCNTWQIIIYLQAKLQGQNPAELEFEMYRGR